jgi:hypothetical protein
MVIPFIMLGCTAISFGQQEQGALRTELVISEEVRGSLEIPPEFEFPNPVCIEIKKIGSYIFPLKITIHLSTNMAPFFIGIDPVTTPSGHIEFTDDEGQVHQMKIAFALLGFDGPHHGRHRPWIPGHQLKHIRRRIQQGGTYRWNIYLMIHTNAFLPSGNYKGSYSVFCKNTSCKQILGSFAICVQFSPKKHNKKYHNDFFKKQY